MLTFVNTGCRKWELDAFRISVKVTGKEGK